MQWHWADESQRQHAAEEAELAEFARNGSISPETLVWNETLPDWRPAGEARPDWFDGVSQPPTLTPAQVQAARRGVDSGAMSPAARTDPLAVCSLVFGVLGIVGAVILFCFPVFGIPGVICGHLALKRAGEPDSAPSNRGLAIGGLATGYISIAILLLLLLVAALLGVAFIEGMGPEAAGEFDPSQPPAGEE